MIGNSDANGVRNNQGEFILPLTLDLFTDKPLSVYFGPGISTNVDSSGLTVFSLSGGVDIRLSNRLKLSAGLSYAFDADTSGRGDTSAQTILYYKL